MNDEKKKHYNIMNTMLGLLQIDSAGYSQNLPLDDDFVLGYISGFMATYIRVIQDLSLINLVKSEIEEWFSTTFNLHYGELNGPTAYHKFNNEPSTPERERGFKTAHQEVSEWAKSGFRKPLNKALKLYLIDLK